MGVRELLLLMLAWKAWEKSVGGAMGALIWGIEFRKSRPRGSEAEAARMRDPRWWFG